MAAPFVVRPVPKRPSTWLAKKPPARGALVELENSLARAARLREVMPGARHSVEGRYGLDLPQVSPQQLEALFVRYLRHGLHDGRLSDDEVAEMVQLKQLLGVSDRRARALHDSTVGPIYRVALEDQLSRFGLRPDHQAFLDELREALLLSDEHTSRLHRGAAAPVMKHAESLAFADARLSPEEQLALRALAKQFDLERPAASTDRQFLDRLCEYWRLDNSDLPTLDAPITLMPGERVHHIVHDVTWTAGRRALEPFGDAAARLRSLLEAVVPKRFRPKRPHARMRFEPWVFDTENLYLTNRHLHFDGTLRMRTIPLLRIVRVRPGDGRLAIERVARGPTVILKLPGNTDEAYLRLTRLIRDARWWRAYRPRRGLALDAPFWDRLATLRGGVRER